MTLIVAYCDGKNISSVSDTTLTKDKNSHRNEPWRGTLKLIVIDKHRFIGFAGSTRDAHRSIKKFMQQNGSVLGSIPTQDILQILLEDRKLFQGDRSLVPDFIVGELLGSTANLHKVSNSIEINVPNAWIGSKDSFGYYQQFYHKERARLQELCGYDLPGDSGFAMQKAMLDVIDDDKNSGVGGFPLALHSNANREFEYVSFMESYNSVVSKEVLPDGWSPVNFGTAGQGGYTYDLLVPSETGIAAVGVYILQMSKTIVFCRPMREKDEVLTGVRHKAIDWIKENLGFELIGTKFG
jgi:hypothetical protein